MGLRAGVPTPAPHYHAGGPDPYGGACGLPHYPTSPDDTSTVYPCNSTDVHSFYMSAWWNNWQGCYDQCYLNKQVYQLEDHTTGEKFCGAMPKTGCFDGRCFANCMADAIGTQEGAVAMSCNLCIGSTLWHLLKESSEMDICQEEMCHPRCNYQGYNLIDMCSGSLNHHLAVCRLRPNAVIQRAYSFPTDPVHKEMKAYEDQCVADECGTKKSSTETSAKTKSSTGTMAGKAVLKNILEETLRAGNADPAIGDMLAKLG